MWGNRLAMAVNRTPSLNLVTCYSRNAEKRGAFAAKFGCETADSFSEAITHPLVQGVLLVTPIIAALTRQVIDDLWTEYEEQLRSLGAGPARAVTALLWDGRFTLLTAILAGFGRASAEVGAVMMVGGNIDHVTRVMTTAIALEVSKGDLALALGLGIILIVLSCTVNAAAFMLKEASQKAYG